MSEDEAGARAQDGASELKEGREAEEAAATDAEALVLEVTEEEAGARLDAFLAARIEGWSRAALQRLIDEGEVLVEGLARKPSYKLRASERVEVELVAPPAPLQLTPEELPLEVVFEDDQIIVVNKAAGMVVHPGAGVHSGTLANAVAYRLQKTGGALPSARHDAASDEGATDERPPAAADQQHLRPGIVHRLDRDTSGLVVVAKTIEAHEKLSEQFRAREVFKLYSALVHGQLKEDKGKVEEPVGRDPRQRTRMGVVRRGGRAALTLYRVRRRFRRFSLLDVEIKTGRTHQIRVHMAWLKHPVVGDALYGGGRDQNMPNVQLRTLVAALGRQFLHATRLGFRHPRTGEYLRFDAPLPAELADFLARLEALDA